MKLTAIADLHLDLWEEAKRDPLELLDDQVWASDIVVLAGDISNHGAKKWRRLLAGVLERIEPGKVHVIPGNHDYYGHHLDRDDKLQAACDELGCHFAQQAEVRIDETRRLLMCTLWTDYGLGSKSLDLNMYAAQKGMNDYRKIRLVSGGYRRIWPSDLRTVHLRHLSWLQEKLADGFAGETTIVTHHAPHPGAIPHPDADLACAYASDLSEMIEECRPRRWLYGHTHTAADFVVSGCEIANVSVGYPGETDLSVAQPQLVFDI